jgi:hypothetical protein
VRLQDAVSPSRVGCRWRMWPSIRVSDLVVTSPGRADRGDVLATQVLLTAAQGPTRTQCEGSIRSARTERLDWLLTVVEGLAWVYVDHYKRSSPH